MFEKPLKHIKTESFEDVLEKSISLNANSKMTNNFVVRCLGNDLYHPYTIFIDENGNMHLTFEDVKEILEKNGYKQIEGYKLGFNVEVNPDVESLRKQYFLNRENLFMWQIFDRYREKTGCDECNISLYGLNYERLDFHPCEEFGKTIYESDKYVLRVDKLFTITTIINDIAKFEVCYDENIIVCIDEFGRLQILSFANIEDLLEAVNRLKNAKFSEGFSVSFNPVFERKSQKNANLFELIRIDKRSKK